MNYSEIINRFKTKKILVVGDIMLDEYILGSSVRISPEAPVPVVNKSGEHFALGGSANVANNLRQLGVKTYLVGLVGKDIQGRKVKSLLKSEGFDEKNILTDSLKPTTLKTRIVSNGQQIARIDNEDSSDVSTNIENQLINRVSKVVRKEKPDAVILSDYNKGLITGKVSKQIIRLAQKCGAFISVDPKGEDFLKYSGADLITPNSKEAELVTGGKLDTEKEVKSTLKKLLTLSKAKSALITRGKDGASYLNSDGKFSSAAARKINVFDVTGAGDTFISVFTLSYIISGSWESSAQIANIASALVVSSFGTTHTNADELLKASIPDVAGSKIVKLSGLKKIVSLERKNNKKIVFTNGCFDLLHPGHIKIIRESKKFGDILIVALNSDSSVRKLKGSGRPIVDADERAHLIALMDDVDYVVIFNELTPLKLIKQIKPDIITKGGDYKKNEIVGSDFVNNNGGQVVTIPLLKNHSTSKLINKINKG